MIWLLIACGIPDAEDAPEEAAELYCDRAVECDWIAIAQQQDCVDEYAYLFQLNWPTRQCDGAIDRSSWRECEDALEAMACDNEDWGVSQIGECDASRVCSG